MAFDSKEFANEILNGIQVDDATKAAITKTLTTPEVADKLKDRFEGNLRQADYSRLAAETQNLKQRAESYYSELVQWKKDEAARLTALEAATRQTPGYVDPAIEPNSEYLSRKDFEIELQKVQNGAVGFMTTLTDQSMDYYQRFNKKLDTKAVVEKAAKDGTNILIAYERYIQPDLESQQKTELERRLKDEREAGRKEALANITIPVNTQPLDNNPHPLDGLNNANKEQFGWKAAAKAHGEAIRTGKTIG